MQTVILPDQTRLNFPDGMSQGAMADAITRNFPQFAPGGPGGERAPSDSAPAPGAQGSGSDWEDDSPIRQDMAASTTDTPEQTPTFTEADMPNSGLAQNRDVRDFLDQVLHPDLSEGVAGQIVTGIAKRVTGQHSESPAANQPTPSFSDAMSQLYELAKTRPGMTLGALVKGIEEDPELLFTPELATVRTAMLAARAAEYGKVAGAAAKVAMEAGKAGAVGAGAEAVAQVADPDRPLDAQQVVNTAGQWAATAGAVHAAGELAHAAGSMRAPDDAIPASTGIQAPPEDAPPVQTAPPGPPVTSTIDQLDAIRPLETDASRNAMAASAEAAPAGQSDFGSAQPEQFTQAAQELVKAAEPPPSEKLEQSASEILYQPTLEDAIQKAHEVATGAQPSTPPEPEPLALPVEDIRRSLEPVANALASHGKTLEVVPTIDDLPADVRPRLDSLGDGVEGVYAGHGRVYLVASKLQDMGRVQQVAAHEVIGHLAPEELIGAKTYQNALDNVRLLDKGGNKTVRALAQRVDESQPGLDPQSRAKEILAQAVETGAYKDVKTLSRIVSDLSFRLKDALISHGINARWATGLTEQDVFAMLREGERRLYRNAWPVEPTLNAPLLSREGAQNLVPAAQSSPARSPIRNYIAKLADDLRMKVDPMSAGSEYAQAAAKDAANAMRVAQYNWYQVDGVLKKDFTPQQLERMWNASDEESVMRQQGLTDPAKGLGALAPAERAVVERMQAYNEEVRGQMQAAGMLRGEGLPYWTPRMAAMIGDDGGMHAPKEKPAGSPSNDGAGSNITVDSPHLLHRKHLTADETEAAMKAKLGSGATLVRNLRVIPLALSRIENAVAGRELINSIKELGERIGENLVSDYERPGFFTLDHPAFKTYAPRMVERDGAKVPAMDQNGETILDHKPLWVSRQFEGPLKAIMSEKPGAIYQGFMQAKAEVMNAIMASPMIHNMVVFGKALPALPGKVITAQIYRDGARYLDDHDFIREAISNGLVLIGHQGFKQEMTGVLEPDSIRAGRSWTAKALGYAADKLRAGSGQRVREVVDAVGDFVHNKLLWDQVQKLQVGLYANFRDRLIAEGHDPQTASRIAAHDANRFAGAIPNESMSYMSRAIANFTLFSRSFTMTNLGIMKDAIHGLPGDVAAQIKRDMGEFALRGARDAGRRKALMAIALDTILGYYVINSFLQDAVNVYKDRKTWGDVGRGYLDRFAQEFERIKENPLNILSAPSRLWSLAENEPGHEGRIFWEKDKSGTAIYLRNPVGKIGEELIGWATSPIEEFKRKESTFLRPMAETAANDKGFGKHVYNPDAHAVSLESLKNMGRIVTNFMENQIPLPVMMSAFDLANKAGDSSDTAQLLGYVTGITPSHGAPGGPAVGQMLQAKKEYRERIEQVMPDVKRDIKYGRIDDAAQKLLDAGMVPAEVGSMLTRMLVPESRLSARAVEDFQKHATEEQRQAFDGIAGR